MPLGADIQVPVSPPPAQGAAVARFVQLVLPIGGVPTAVLMPVAVLADADGNPAPLGDVATKNLQLGLVKELVRIRKALYLIAQVPDPGPDSSDDVMMGN